MRVVGALPLGRKGEARRPAHNALTFGHAIPARFASAFALAAPTQLTASTVGEDAVTLSWSAGSTLAASYLIYGKVVQSKRDLGRVYSLVGNQTSTSGHRPP